MAAVSILPSTHTQPSMSMRRVPLGNNTNAANSPFRGNVNEVGTKSKRSHAAIDAEQIFVTQNENQRAAKRRTSVVDVEKRQVHAQTPPRRPTATDALESHVFSRRAHAQPTAFVRKLEDVRAETTRRRPVNAATQQAQRAEAHAIAKAERIAEKAAEDNLETIRKWQRHYRKVFPTMVFYFDSVPDHLRDEVLPQVTSLGARQEMFFSNKVTHVITTRTIPPEGVVPPKESNAQSARHDSQQPQTINPSLLDRVSEAPSTQAESLLKARLGLRKASQPPTTVLDENKKQARSADVLIRAREIGIKIWALEKVKRMMSTMFDGDVEPAHGHNTRATSAQAISRSAREADLSTLLRNEKIYGPGDRDFTAPARDLILFKGPFIYIHDIDGKLKPIMVREYQKPQTKETGDWPQFRSVSQGKCPFVPEADSSRRDAERELIREQRRQLEKERIEKERLGATRTRSAAAAVEAAQRMQPPAQPRRALTQTESTTNSAATISAEQSTYSQAEGGEEQPNAYVKRADPPARLFNGEPVASGIQNSITSAIHSQMVSSTANAIGGKAGTSKEVHALGRRVLEKNSAAPALTTSRRMNDLSLAAQDNAGVQKRKTTRQESFNDENEDPRRAEKKQAKLAQRRKPVERAPKAGYCENCMDKFDDFDEHILSRKHRRFAEKAENWRELDELLNELGRPYRNGGRDNHSDL